MKSVITDPSDSQQAVKWRTKFDPLLTIIIGTAILLTGLTLMMYLSWGTGQPLGDTPWYIPVAHSFAGLAAFSVAFLALGRYPVVRDPASYWIGIGFLSFGIQSVFFVLTWPGLGTGGQAIIARLPSTSGWIAVFELLSLSVSFLLAVLSTRPGSTDRFDRLWRWTVFVWSGVALLICIFIVVLEASLPLLVDAAGMLTPLLLSLDWVFLFLFFSGAILSVRRYLRTGDALLGYVALAQLALTFVVLTAIIGAKRYDIWYYLSRIILVGGFLALMFGLLAEYVRMYRREHEGRLMLEAILENIPIGLSITGGPPDFLLAKVSRHGLEMNQRSAKDLIGMPSGRHQHAWKIYLSDGSTQPAPEQMPLYRASRFGEEIRNFEMVMEAGDGQKIPVLVNAAPIRDAAGKILAAVNAWLDISERKRAEESLQTYAKQLERANRDLQNFTIVASHDLQEPLRKIEVIGDAVLKDSANLNGRQHDHIRRMRQSAQQMRDMVNGLLQLSLLSTDIQPFQAVDLRETTQQVLSDFRDQFQQSGGSIEIGELPVIEADPIQMRRLLHHLIENALKFQPSDKKPLVKIYSIQTSPSAVQIMVEDNGIGFDEAIATHLFEPFERLVSKKQTAYGGIGIGLAICRSIVERHDGEITVRSEPGQGTIFIVVLPVHQPGRSKARREKELNHVR